MIGEEKQDEVCCSDDSQLRLPTSRERSAVNPPVAGERIGGWRAVIQTR